MQDLFHKIAAGISNVVGSSYAFITALLLIILWAVNGPIFNFSDTWQLAINTTTTIVTFLMVFLIQNTQNRDAKAIHLKLDELLHSEKGASNKLIDAEELPDDELERLHSHYTAIYDKYNRELERRKKK